MIKIIKRLIKAIYNRFLIVIDPVKFARLQGVVVGENVKFYGATPGMFGSEPWLITIGNNVHIVSGCHFVNHDGGVLILRHKYPDLELTAPIKIGDNVYIGMNCTILPGVSIGDNVIVGAGSIVTKSFPGGVVIAGVPARVIKKLDDYIDKARLNSLGFGHYSGDEKAVIIKKHFNIKR